MQNFGDILKRLTVLDSERVELLTRLRTMGFRSRGFVGEYGELLASALYDAPLSTSSSQPGYDLEVPQLGLVQVKTLRSSTPSNLRTSMGIMKDPYDVLLAIRLDADYQPVAAWEIPRAAVELVYPHGSRTSLTAKLLADSAVAPVAQERLAAAARRVAAGQIPA